MEIVEDSPYRFVIPRHGRMRVPGVVFATRALIPDPAADRSLQQVVNVVELPGIVGASYAMPDVHRASSSSTSARVLISSSCAWNCSSLITAAPVSSAPGGSRSSSALARASRSAASSSARRTAMSASPTSPEIPEKASAMLAWTRAAV